MNKLVSVRVTEWGNTYTVWTYRPGRGFRRHTASRRWASYMIHILRSKGYGYSFIGLYGFFWIDRRYAYSKLEEKLEEGRNA